MYLNMNTTVTSWVTVVNHKTPNVLLIS